MLWIFFNFPFKFHLSTNRLCEVFGAHFNSVPFKFDIEIDDDDIDVATHKKPAKCTLNAHRPYYETFCISFGLVLGTHHVSVSLRPETTFKWCCRDAKSLSRYFLSEKETKQICQAIAQQKQLFTNNDKSDRECIFMNVPGSFLNWPNLMRSFSHSSQRKWIKLRTNLWNLPATLRPDWWKLVPARRWADLVEGIGATFIPWVEITHNPVDNPSPSMEWDGDCLTHITSKSSKCMFGEPIQTWRRGQCVSHSARNVRSQISDKMHNSIIQKLSVRSGEEKSIADIFLRILFLLRESSFDELNFSNEHPFQRT